MIVLDFIQKYNGALSVAGTLIVAFMTFFSIRIATKTLKEMRETREQENRPYVLVDLHKDDGMPTYEIYIRNYGKTAARINSISINPQINLVYNKTCNDIFNGTVIMPGQVIYMYTSIKEKNEIKEQQEFQVECNYSALDNKNKNYTEKYPLSIVYTAHLNHIERSVSNLSPEANQLKNIAWTLENLRKKL